MLFCLLLLSLTPLPGQNSGKRYLLRPDRVFDGREVHENWAVLVEGNLIRSVGPGRDLRPAAGDEVLDLPGCTLLPGLIEGHAHVLLHPYNETSWNDQVLVESEAKIEVRT